MKDGSKVGLCAQCGRYPCKCGGKSDESTGNMPYSVIGWVCPVCGAGNAPTVERCACVKVVHGSPELDMTISYPVKYMGGFYVDDIMRIKDAEPGDENIKIGDTMTIFGVDYLVTSKNYYAKYGEIYLSFSLKAQDNTEMAHTES